VEGEEGWFLRGGHLRGRREVWLFGWEDGERIPELDKGCVCVCVCDVLRLLRCL
jgi:hypothetical protein